MPHSWRHCSHIFRSIFFAECNAPTLDACMCCSSSANFPKIYDILVFMNLQSNIYIFYLRSTICTPYMNSASQCLCRIIVLDSIKAIIVLDFLLIPVYIRMLIIMLILLGPHCLLPGMIFVRIKFPRPSTQYLCLRKFIWCFMMKLIAPRFVLLIPYVVSQSVHLMFSILLYTRFRSCL